jgi:serine/threonine protein kinase
VVIGRYEIVKELGEGGMGMVYLAKDPALGRLVAVKIISKRRTAESEWLRSRFLQEAKVVALLNHPSIVSIFDLGEHEGQPYIVMEYVPGLSLHHLLQQRRLTSQEIIISVRSVAVALDYAHRHKIIHRDIKPANLLIGNTGLKVSDFGLAKISTAPNEVKTRVAGTLPYMAPELFGGVVLPQSDQYALAALAYELLVGRTMFQAESEAELIYKICNEPVALAHVVCSEVNEAASEVLNKGLAKKPTDRFAKCQDFAQSLELGLAGKRSHQAAPPPRAAQANRPAPGPIIPPSFKTESPTGSGKILLTVILGTVVGVILLSISHTTKSLPVQPISSSPQVAKFSQVPPNNALSPSQILQQTTATTQAGASSSVLDSSKTINRKTVKPNHEPLRRELPNKQLVANSSQSAVHAKAAIAKQNENASTPVGQSPATMAQSADTPLDGRLVWSGTLEMGQEIDLSASSAAGVVSGSLPGVPVSVEVHPSSIRIVTAPGPDNQWRKIVVQNDNTKRSIVVVRWSVIRR